MERLGLWIDGWVGGGGQHIFRKEKLAEGVIALTMLGKVGSCVSDLDKLYKHSRLRGKANHRRGDAYPSSVIYHQRC